MSYKRVHIRMAFVWTKILSFFRWVSCARDSSQSLRLYYKSYTQRPKKKRNNNNAFKCGAIANVVFVCALNLWRLIQVIACSIFFLLYIYTPFFSFNVVLFVRISNIYFACLFHGFPHLVVSCRISLFLFHFFRECVSVNEVQCYSFLFFRSLNTSKKFTFTQICCFLVSRFFVEKNEQRRTNKHTSFNLSEHLILSLFFLFFYCFNDDSECVCFFSSTCQRFLGEYFLCVEGKYA